MDDITKPITELSPQEELLEKLRQAELEREIKRETERKATEELEKAKTRHFQERAKDLEMARQSEQTAWENRPQPEILPSQKALRSQQLQKLKGELAFDPYYKTSGENVRNIDIGALEKAKEAEINQLRKTLASSTKLEPRSVEKIINPSSVSAEEAALSKLGKGLGIASGVAGGALMAKDISENKPTEAALTGLETGLGYLGKTAGRAAPFLELLRAIPTASEQQELSEIAKYKRQQEAEQQELTDLDKWKNINSTLSKKSKKERDLASE